MLIRMHKGGLAESMSTLESIDATTEAVRDYLLSMSDLWPPEGIANLKVKLYRAYLDTRIDWDRTYIVLVNGSPCAFCNSSVKGNTI